MSALSKAMIVEALCSDLGLAKVDAKLILDQFFEEIRQVLEQGSHVKLSGFGNFILRDKPVRPGRNPKTGEEIPVTARRVVTFKPGFKLKSKIDAREKLN
jgi:integration host factor subunit alpha